MKLSIITSVAALVFGIASSAQAVQPFTTAYGGWGTSSNGYYVPSTPAYGYTPSYNSYGYSTYPSYSTYPQYGSTWNTPNYQTPRYTYDPVHGDYHLNGSNQSYTYDPVHGDYHVNNGNSVNTWNNGCSQPSHRPYGYGQVNGYRW